MARIKALIAGGLVLTSLAVIGVQHLRLGMAQSRAETAEASLEQCKQNRMILAQAVEDQNDAIAELKAKADAQAERIALAAQDAAQARREAEARVRRVLAETVPEECSAAVQWGAEKAGELAKRWM